MPCASNASQIRQPFGVRYRPDSHRHRPERDRWCTISGAAAVDDCCGVALAAGDDLVGAPARGQAEASHSASIAAQPWVVPYMDTSQLGQVPVRAAGNQALAVALVAHRSPVGQSARVERARETVAVGAGVVFNRARPRDGGRPPSAKSARSRTPVQSEQLKQFAAGRKFRPMHESCVSRNANVSPTAPPGALFVSRPAGVLVHAVAPLVDQDARQFPGVRTAPPAAKKLTAVPSQKALQVCARFMFAVSAPSSHWLPGRNPAALRLMLVRWKKPVRDAWVLPAPPMPGVVQSVPPLAPKSSVPVVPLDSAGIGPQASAIATYRPVEGRRGRAAAVDVKSQSRRSPSRRRCSPRQTGSPRRLPDRCWCGGRCHP